MSDLLEHLPNIGKYQSSSERKAERLPLIFRGTSPDLVVAIGTAALPSEASENGDVVIGTEVFMHDGHPNGSNPDSKWNGGPFDQLLPSALSEATFKAFTKLDNNVADRLLSVPLNPSWRARVLARQSYVALGTTNVTDPAEYEAADNTTLEAFLKARVAGKAMSVETTHGLIRAQSASPFLFISGIANRVGWYGDEVIPRSYAQNMAAAHNAGVAVTWMLPNIDKTI